MLFIFHAIPLEILKQLHLLHFPSSRCSSRLRARSSSFHSLQYTTPLSSLISDSSVKHYFYAEDSSGSFLFLLLFLTKRFSSGSGVDLFSTWGGTRNGRRSSGRRSRGVGVWGEGVSLPSGEGSGEGLLPQCGGVWPLPRQILIFHMQTEHLGASF